MINKNFLTSLIFLILLLVVLVSAPLAKADSLFDAKRVSMFQDNRAREVGDILTIIVLENTIATNKGSSKFEKKIGMSGGVRVEGVFDYLFPNFFQPFEPLKSMDIDPSEKFDGTGETSSNNNFTTRMTATVIEVLPNGNLVVEGSRSIKVNEEDQELVLRGVIRPTDVTPANTILSSNIADAEIYYKGKGPIGRRNKPGIMSQFFNWVF
jgi:flagellar L-ring protein precursor FlgH